MRSGKESFARVDSRDARARSRRGSRRGRGGAVPRWPARGEPRFRTNRGALFAGERRRRHRILSQAKRLFLMERLHRVGLSMTRRPGAFIRRAGHERAPDADWSHGIRGENQIAAVLDTGLDANSCYYTARRSQDQHLVRSERLRDGDGCDAPQGHCLQFSLFLRPVERRSQLRAPLEPDPLGHAGSRHACRRKYPGGQRQRSGHVHRAGRDGAGRQARRSRRRVPLRYCAELPGLGCPVIALDPFSSRRACRARAPTTTPVETTNKRRRPDNATTARGRRRRSVSLEPPRFSHRLRRRQQRTGNAEFSVGSPRNKNEPCDWQLPQQHVLHQRQQISAFSSRGWTSDGASSPISWRPVQRVGRR